MMQEDVEYYYSKFNSLVGDIYLVSCTKKLRAVLFECNWEEYVQKLSIKLIHKRVDIIQKAEIQLKEYFRGVRKQFDVPLEFSGTNFQKKAWESLLTIPYGETISYSEQAQLIHNPKAVRAVGGANGKNNLCILVPCHRVIGKDGSLTGFSSGKNIKEKLLKLEASSVCKK